MRYLKLTLAYDGSNYHGFQRQKNAVGIQQIVEKALSIIFGEEIFKNQIIFLDKNRIDTLASKFYSIKENRKKLTKR